MNPKELIERVVDGADPKKVVEADDSDVGYSLQVIDKNQDKEKIVQDIRAGYGREAAKATFDKQMKKYGNREGYVVQLLITKSDKVVMDNQGSGGKVRTFK